MKRPLYINDFGFHCILGGNKEDVLAKLSRGERGNFSCLDVDGVVRPAAVIDMETLPPVQDPRFDYRINRLSNAALSGIDETICKMVELYGTDRVGIFMGSCDNGSEASLQALKCLKQTGFFPEGYALDYQSVEFPARYVAERYGITGMLEVHSTACASSVSAFVSARNNIYAGNCDAAIVGGVDIAALPVILGFASLEAMSDKPTNPFSANRSGLTLGDAAAFFVITGKPDHALCKEDCKGLMVEGFGESADADHITAPRADGEGAYQAMKAALEDAELEPSQIDYVNLHGTGTRLNDAMEGLAVNRLLGEDVPISSTKALTGHTLGAAGALETAFCCMALKRQVLPAHLYDGVSDPQIPKVHLVSPGEKPVRLKRCLSNSFAFGGCNASLVITDGSEI
ncbi:MAG: beta-ketoacyl synthase [Fibrobacter sp.]|nr:beta-ketoacyl synthase [Fibrobacter sp.]